jgi:hypothetical protein
MNKFKANSLIKATTTTLAACLLMACGGDDSEDTNYTLSLASAETGIVGESVFSVVVTDEDGLAVYGETPSLNPMMAMTNGMLHSAPHLGCTASDDQGNSDCTVYFLMPSAMGDEVMGTWTVNVNLDNAEALSFVPSVTMSMAETVKATLKGTDDTLEGLPRNYIIFNSVPAMDMAMPMAMDMSASHSVELFIASKESMMSFPALATNTVLSAGTADELSVDSIEVLVSADKDAQTWTTASSEGNGKWTADIVGYTDTFYVKLSVNSAAKMNGELDYATFAKTASEPMPEMAH